MKIKKELWKVAKVFILVLLFMAAQKYLIKGIDWNSMEWDWWEQELLALFLYGIFGLLASFLVFDSVSLRGGKPGVGSIIGFVLILIMALVDLMYSRAWLVDVIPETIYGTLQGSSRPFQIILGAWIGFLAKAIRTPK